MDTATSQNWWPTTRRGTIVLAAVLVPMLPTVALLSLLRRTRSGDIAPDTVPAR